jgi:hypothetical protein
MTSRLRPQRDERTWLLLHLGLGLAWCAVLASRAPGGSGPGASGPQVFVMLLAAGWLPSLALAAWQVKHRRWRSLIGSDPGHRHHRGAGIARAIDSAACGLLSKPMQSAPTGALGLLLGRLLELLVFPELEIPPTQPSPPNSCCPGSTQPAPP